jgi:hypothetical protein
MAALLGAELEAAHEDGDSILMLDRPAIQWSGGRSRGLGWVGTDIWPGGAVSDWRQAARLGAAGLAIEGRRRFVHTGVNGLSPLYWTDDRGATYFASLVDPLARTAPAPLSIDWDAWAAIIALRYPLGERTPFAEIRRLGPFATLRRRLGRGRVHAPTWPWLEIEPSTDLDGAADATVEALRAILGELPGGIVCPLSGGLDSRMLFGALAAEGRVATAVTASDDEGETIEEDLAAPVAAEYGVPHERLAGTAANYGEDWEERARRVEHQFVDHAWLVPVARRVEGTGAPVPDGFGFDVFMQSGRHFNRPGALGDRGGRDAGLALFDALRSYGMAHRGLTEEFHAPIVSRSREQYLAATRSFEGHPSQILFATYATRSRRGPGSYPTGLLGSGARVVAPGASDPVVSATLSTTTSAKAGGGLYEAIFERLAPPAGLLPSTTDTPRTGPRLPRRWRSAPALEAHRRLLGDGPLAPHLSPELRGWLAAPDGAEVPGDLRLGMESISLLHSWWQRYRDVLREADPGDLLG